MNKRNVLRAQVTPRIGAEVDIGQRFEFRSLAALVSVVTSTTIALPLWIAGSLDVHADTLASAIVVIGALVSKLAPVSEEQSLADAPPAEVLAPAVAVYLD